ncbi:MAG: hypothetical protein A3H31_13010 [Gallionellales bacterium RIFCSPLOWO2_02_FULL_57_47]|nr:MAG: hypothetical protein A3H31_13010 [Gallionellales bacterium RIFCSPLOWO2_02_FULL_57_47]OGT12909.1 MAG: hypothetical protein A3J49_16960 [Gallionellales bacterium RIFCSPHIGHO2_02_FULL_57_16]
MIRHLFSVCVLAVVLAGCDRVSQPPTPAFELRDFVVTEEQEAATTYSKAWNKFKGSGNVVARNINSDRNVVALLEIRDESLGPNSEPNLAIVLVRGGLGKIEIEKSKYGEISQHPKYTWSVVGWYELQNADIKVVGQPTK